MNIIAEILGSEAQRSSTLAFSALPQRITWAGVLTMCWVGSLGRGCLPCVGWDHLSGDAYHVSGGIT